MKLLRFVAAALPALLIASPAAAYWEFGHETVARIAYANVTPRTRVAIDRLLAQTPMLETPTCPATTIEGASVWADCVKPLKGPDGMRFGDDGKLYLAENAAGQVDVLTISGDSATVEPLQGGFDTPTAVSKVGDQLFVAESKFSKMGGTEDPGQFYVHVIPASKP